MQDCFEALLKMNDNDIAEARRYKNKKLRQLNREELAGVFEDAVTHSFEIVRTDTGDVYDNNALNAWLCQEEESDDDGTGGI